MAQLRASDRRGCGTILTTYSRIGLSIAPENMGHRLRKDERRPNTNKPALEHSGSKGNRINMASQLYLVCGARVVTEAG